MIAPHGFSPARARHLRFGRVSSCTHDKAERAESIRHFKSDGTALAYFEYGRDGRGNIVRIGRLDGLTTYYSYDEADRLASEAWKDSGGSTIYAYEWGYDLAGNRTSAVEQGESIAWAYNAAGAVTSRVDDSGATYYHHDLDGNLEVIEAPGGAVTYFEHGDHGLLTKIKPLGGTEISFAYDGMLRRVRVDEGTDHTYFRHDGINFIEIANPDGTVTKVTHGHADIPGIGSVTEEETDGTSVFSIKDHRGTREAEVDAGGNVTRRAYVNAFGLEIAASGPASSIFWYQGEAWWKLIVNGRTYYVSPTRIYDTRDGRFIERDSKTGTAGDYSYALHSPAYRVDPNGDVAAHLDVLNTAMLAATPSSPGPNSTAPMTWPESLMLTLGGWLEGRTAEIQTAVGYCQMLWMAGKGEVVYPWCRKRHRSPDRAGGYTTWKSLRLRSWFVQECRGTC